MGPTRPFTGSTSASTRALGSSHGYIASDSEAETAPSNALGESIVSPCLTSVLTPLASSSLSSVVAFNPLVSFSIPSILAPLELGVLIVLPTAASVGETSQPSANLVFWKYNLNFWYLARGIQYINRRYVILCRRVLSAYCEMTI